MPGQIQKFQKGGVSNSVFCLDIAYNTIKVRDI